MFKKKQTQQRRPISSKPADVFSYHSSRSGSETARARYEAPPTHKRGLERLKHIPTVLALVVIVICVVYASLLDSKPRVMVSASTTGKSLQRPNKVYEDFITNTLKQSIFNKSKLTFDSSTIVSDLQKQYPEVANAIVTVPLLGHRPVVRIAVSSPAFILATSSGAYYISAEGQPLVRVADVQHQLANIVTVTDEANVPVTVGKQVLPSATVSFIRNTIDQLSATNNTVQTITLPLAANEVQVQIVGQPYLVRFNTLEDARTQVGTYLAVKKRLEGSGQIPKEYIDVRVVERAYYK